MDKGIQTPMAQGRSAKVISMIKRIRTSRLSIMNSLSLACQSRVIRITQPPTINPRRARIQGSQTFVPPNSRLKGLLGPVSRVIKMRSRKNHSAETSHPDCSAGKSLRRDVACRHDPTRQNQGGSCQERDRRPRRQSAQRATQALFVKVCPLFR